MPTMGSFGSPYLPLPFFTTVFIIKLKRSGHGDKTTVWQPGFTGWALRQRRPAPFKNSTVFFGGIRRIPRGGVGKQSPTDSPSVNPFSYRYLRFVKKRGKESFI
uniref:Uncharacterized protein n=1 Tax=Placozoa sp. H9 HM-2017 TaxID=2017597 RepID=A0A7I6N453_9METZ|nr:hypothetical protein [Placozoa sp. H9 HM-2017]